MAKRKIECYLCNTSFQLKENEPDPGRCPVCDADLANPGLETIRESMDCEHLKGNFGIGTGNLFVTNKRIFWMARKDEDSGNALVSMATAKNANKIGINIPLDNIAWIEDCKKIFRKGVTLHTKNNEAFNLFGNQKKLKEILSPYAAG